jgi:hypothetical protein
MGCTPLGELWFVAYSLYASAQLEFSLFLRLAGIVMSGCGMHAIVPFMTGVIRVVHVKKKDDLSTGKQQGFLQPPFTRFSA